MDNANSETGRLLTPEEVAEILQIPSEQVVRRARAGEFPHVRIGRRYRFTDGDIAAIITGHHRDTTPVPDNPWGVRRRPPDWGRRRRQS